MDISHDDLRFFLSLWETRSLSRTAQKLNLTLPTASRRMAKLRAIFQDSCFIRSPQGLLPTALTEEIIDQIRRADSDLSALVKQKPFDPAQLKRVIRIATPDNAIPYLLNHVLKALVERAPHSTVVLSHSDSGNFDLLQKGRLDFIIYPKSLLPSGHHYMPLHVFEQVIVVRKGHPLIETFRQKGHLSAEDLSRYGRVLINDNYADRLEGGIFISSYDRHFSNDTVQKNKIVLPYYLGAPYFLENTDFTLTLPKETAEKIVERNPRLSLLPNPLAKQNSIVTCLFWHDRSHHDPAMQWVRSLFKMFSQTDIAAEMEHQNHF